MTIYLSVGDGKTYQNISDALNSIHNWDSSYIIEVYNDVTDAVVMKHSTTASKNLTIKGIGKKPVWDGGTSKNFYAINNCHLKLENIELRNSRTSLIKMKKGYELVLDKTFINDIGTEAMSIRIYNNTSSFKFESYNSIIKGQISADFNGITTWNTYNNTFYKTNSIYTPYTFAIQNSSSFFWNMKNNIFCSNHKETKFIYYSNSFSWNVSNNIWWNSNVEAISSSWTVGSLEQKDFSWWKKNVEPTAKFANPKFLSIKTGQLQVTLDSPAIDSGINTGLKTDYLSISRPQNSVYDIGAYETVPADSVSSTSLVALFIAWLLKQKIIGN